MFNRKIEKELKEWKEKPGRKPLVMRGARQTGKTTLIRKFSKEFDNYIELNLEKDNIQKIFSEIRDIKEIIQSIEAVSNERIVTGKTLIFIDEIQNSVSAIKLLRYFFEEIPQLHIISAGSLLEVRLRTEGWSFPVGRVEFLYLYPATFEEFLSALGETILLDTLKGYRIGAPMAIPIHEKLLDLLAAYMVIGGMPEAVSNYIEQHNFKNARKCQEGLISSFKEDFAKYSKNQEVEYLKLVWDRVPYEAGSRIKYSKLAGMQNRAKDIVNAFNILHEAMLVERIYPSIGLKPPLVKKVKASPKALLLDIGLCTCTLNLGRDQIKDKLIDPLYSGVLLEEFVGQEILAFDFSSRTIPHFWIREEKGASSEVDFLLPYQDRILPVEVKSGSHGSLKSLHQFLYRSGERLGVRIHNHLPQVEELTVTLPEVNTLKYKLLSIPPYLVFRLKEIISGL